jgi:hypothetical protein
MDTIILENQVLIMQALLVVLDVTGSNNQTMIAQLKEQILFTQARIRALT